MSHIRSKFIIRQEDLRDFLLSDSPPTKDQLHALDLVISAVLIKHYSQYREHFNDLRSQALLYILEGKSSYDQAFSAYNWCYCRCRNGISNYINKYHSKELYVPDILPMSNAATYQTYADLPSEINKFRGYLTGESSFTDISITPQEAANLCCFFATYTKQRSVKVPEFISSNPDAVQMLYRILIHY